MRRENIYKTVGEAYQISWVVYRMNWPTSSKHDTYWHTCGLKGSHFIPMSSVLRCLCTVHRTIGTFAWVSFIEAFISDKENSNVKIVFLNCQCAVYVVQIRMRKISLTQLYDTQLPGKLCSLRDKGKKLSHQVLLHFSFGISTYVDHTKCQEERVPIYIDIIFFHKKIKVVFLELRTPPDIWDIGTHIK